MEVPTGHDGVLRLVEFVDIEQNINLFDCEFEVVYTDSAKRRLNELHTQAVPRTGS